MALCVCAFSWTCKVEAATLSKAEKKQFSKWMRKGIQSDYYMSRTQGPMYSTRFYVYDINGDGHKDVIVSGALGLRDLTFSEIYMHVDGKYKVIPIRGTLKGVSSKGLNVQEDDYEMSYDGAATYYSRVVYKFDKHGKITAEYSYNTETVYSDTEDKKEYVTYLDANGNKISKSKYKKALKQTNKKKNVKMHKLTKRNIKKYLK